MRKQKYYVDGLCWKWFDDEIIGEVTVPCDCGENFYIDVMNIYDEYPCPKCGLKWKMAQTVWVYPVTLDGEKG